MEWAEKVIDGAGDTALWLRGVILGEWEDNRSISQMVADALTGFVPGVGSIITLRDLLAVIIRLARHPEKREQTEEWILLIAMLLPLIITALGALAAGIGALVGAELGAFLRALTLMLVKEGGVALKALVEFFQHHGYGDVIAALRKVKFASYRRHVIDGLQQQIDKLIKLIETLKAKLASLHRLPDWLPGHEALNQALRNAELWIVRLQELKKAARDMIPKSLIELDRRLGALLAGDVKAATQATHHAVAGVLAPKAPKPEPIVGADGKPTGIGKVKWQPDQGNAFKVAERRLLIMAGEREYAIVDTGHVPVGAKSYHEGQKLEYEPVKEMAWKSRCADKVKEGYPDLGTAGRNEYETFSSLRPVSFSAGDRSTLKRVVDVDKPNQDFGAYYNRELPVDGHDLRSGSAVKETWNKNGEYIELTIPPKGDPVWTELHALQEKAADGPVPFEESLKAWEGPAAAQIYKIKQEGKTVSDKFYLSGGKPQLFFDREQIALLKERGFISKRKPTNFPDYDPVLKNIAPKDGPILEVVPSNEAILPSKGQ
jgi:hypothetical protein